MRRKKDGLVYRVEEAEELLATVPKRITVQEAGEVWLKSLVQFRKPSSVSFYRQRLQVFYPWAAANDIEYLDQVTPKSVRKYRDWRLGYMEVSKSTVRHDEVTIKQLTKYGFTEHWLSYDTMRDYDPIPAAPEERTAAQDEELDKIGKVIETWGGGLTGARARETRYVRSRDRMIFLTQIETGARSGEITSMTKKSLLREEGMICFSKSGMSETRKNGDELIVKAGAYWWEQLDQYLSVRAEVEDEDDLMFPLTNGGQMSSQQWAHRFSDYAKAAGVAGLTSHSIRHRVGGQVAEAQGIFAATRQLGQRSMQSAQRYSKQAGKSKEYMTALHAAVSPLETFAQKTGRLNAPPVKDKKRLAYRV